MSLQADRSNIGNPGQGVLAGVTRVVAAASRRMGIPGRERLIRHLLPPHRLVGFRTTIQLADGRRFSVAGDSFLEWSLLFFGTYEPEITRMLSLLVGPDSTAIDVGANVGIHTLTMAKLAHAGRVIACEPHPETAARLRANLALNRLDRTEVLEIALLDHKEQVSLFDSNDTNRGMASLHRYEEWTPISVQGVTLDEVVRTEKISKVDVIKIDVEGYESPVLAGAAEVLARDRPSLIFEYMDWAWENCGYSLRETLDVLRQAGYERFFVIGTHRLEPLVEPLTSSANILAVGKAADLQGLGIADTVDGRAQ